MNLTTLLSLSVNATATDPKDLSTPQEDFVYSQQFAFANGDGVGEANMFGRGRITIPANTDYALAVHTSSMVANKLKTPFNTDALFTTVKAIAVINRSSTSQVLLAPGADGLGDSFPWGGEVVIAPGGLFYVAGLEDEEFASIDILFTGSADIDVEVDVILIGV